MEFDDDEMYVRHLEEWLNQCAPASTRRSREPGGLRRFAEPRLLRLKEEAERFDPDWVLCDASPFDAWVEETHIHATLQRGLPIPFQFVKDAIERHKSVRQRSAGRIPDEVRRRGGAYVQRSVRGVACRGPSSRRPLTVVILPRSDGKDKSQRGRATNSVDLQPERS